MLKTYQAIKQSVILIKDHPWITLPFVLFATLEGIALYFLFLAPQQPFADLLAPPIAKFYGEQYIHYPWHLLKLPLLFYHCRMFLSLLPGMVLSAILIGLIGDLKSGKRPSFWKHLNMSLNRFLALVCIWILNFGILKLFGILSAKVFVWSEPNEYLFHLQLMVYFLSFWVQIIFLYALPLVILTEESLLQALTKNFRYMKRLFFPTSVCMFLSALIYSGLYSFEIDLNGLAARFSPEIIIVVLSSSILLTLVINLLITTTSTLLFIDENQTNSTFSSQTKEVIA